LLLVNLFVLVDMLFGTQILLVKTFMVLTLDEFSENSELSFHVAKVQCTADSDAVHLFFSIHAV